LTWNNKSDQTDLKREVSRSGARLLFQTINPKKFFKNPKSQKQKISRKFFYPQCFNSAMSVRMKCYAVKFWVLGWALFLLNISGKIYVFKSDANIRRFFSKKRGAFFNLLLITHKNTQQIIKSNNYIIFLLVCLQDKL